MCDFSPNGADYGRYEDPGWAGGTCDSKGQPPAYGPSSAHAGVVQVGMGDGSVQSLAKRCDAANLMFLITKNGGEPFNMP